MGTCSREGDGQALRARYSGNIEKTFNATALTQDAAGLLWLGTVVDGLFVFDPQAEAFIAHYPHDPVNPHSPSNAPAIQLYRSREDVLWVGMGFGMTALTETEDKVRGLEAGAVDYVTKPLDAAELLARVNTHLQVHVLQEELHQSNAQLTHLVKHLQAALAEIRTLQGIIPICTHCKRIRNDTGFWQQVEVYIQEHSRADLSHGICPSCLEQHYREFADNTIPVV
jgi:hypothetical protein